jgi:hypothetical protein
VCHQGAEAGEEEEDKERDQDLAKPVWGTQYCCFAGCCQGQPGKSLFFYN